MKATFELPDALVKQLKLRDLQEGRKLKDSVADLLRKGLAATETEPHAPAPRVGRDKETGMPLIECQHAASAHEEMTPERVAGILLAQETDWQDAAEGSRLGSR